jgi:sigma-54 specific flagellar transcriptional regulator A
VRELSNLVDRFSTLFPSQALHVQTVPACMMPSGLAALQTQSLAQMPVKAIENLGDFLPGSASVSQVERGDNTMPLADVEATSTDVSSGPWSQTDPLAHLFSADEGSESLAVARSLPAALLASNDEMNDVEEVILLAQGIQTLPPDGISLKQHLIEVERSLIEQALTRTQGNVSQTAKLLQLQRTTLIEKINKYDLRGVG